MLTSLLCYNVDMKKYRFGFDYFGLVVFGLIMIPNVIWAFMPPAVDVLRKDSVTPLIDIIGSVFQVLMIAGLTFIVNSQKPRLSLSFSVILCIACILIYSGCWIFYFNGIAVNSVIIGITITPCFAFIFAALERSNYLSLIPIAGFTVCHLIFTLVNFIIP